jgi:alpha-beta hydrolase superfamily lysophospholipase
MATDTHAPDTIVLIHGLWVSALSWEHWAARYTDKGYTVIARGWPGMEGDLDELRKDPSALGDIGAADVIDHYAAIIEALDRPPIIMGHSFGGSFTEVLLDRGLGAAGVAIDAAAVKGIAKLPFSTLRSAWSGLKKPGNRHRPIEMTAAEFHYAFTNTLDEDAAADAYERYWAPGPGGVLFEGALANLTPGAAFTVDFAQDDRAPLLLISGGADHVVPASTDQAMAKKYEKSGALTEYREFPGRTHFTLGQPGWEEVADYALEWAVEHARTAPESA